MRGLDEPEQFPLAYTIHPGDSIVGFISLGQNYSLVDKDMFLIPCNNEEAVEISVIGDTTLMDSIFVYDKFQQLLFAQIITDSAHQIHINLPDYNPNSLYICLSGTAGIESWQNPYYMVVSPVESFDKTEISASSTKVYPNPANQKLHIKTKHNNQVFAVLTNLQGKKVMQFHFSGHYELNTSSLMPGIYCLSLKNKKITEHHKIIIKR
ncbi:MAG: T9SS type A sorting domain-containing protein [Bacteroidota bacterium]|nr:T9SS type A sorting domain-containing protein [Bacteroidota bacterium]